MSDNSPTGPQAKSDRVAGQEKAHEKTPKNSGAFFVAFGILLSRISGLVRERFFAHFFGNSDAADAFKAALRIPNFLQNLFGEGVLSASFIPVYSGLLAQGRASDARKLAAVVGSLLFLVCASLVLLGIWCADLLTTVLAPGFIGEKREVTVLLVQILFPGTGILVLSAWCLGILNSHRRFFLPYVAPVLWNLAIIVTLLLYGSSSEQYRLASIVSWGVVCGSVLQLVVQLPAVYRLLGEFRFSLKLGDDGVGTVIGNFFPVVLGRGVVQISAYVDSILASLLPTGAVSALAYAQAIYLLPISLFGMSVSAAELPAMSSVVKSGESWETEFRNRLVGSVSRVVFYVIPSAVVMLVLGNLLTCILYQSGQFTVRDTNYVWMVLAGATVGLVASVISRLYSSAFYALGDPRTPVKVSIFRVMLGIPVGYVASQYLPDWLGIDRRWGLVGLSATMGVIAWFEFLLLRRALFRRIGVTRIDQSLLAKLWIISGLCAMVVWGVLIFWLENEVGFISSLLLLGAYSLLYLTATRVCGIKEADGLLRRFR